MEKNTFLKKMGRSIKEYRREKGITQRDLAERAAVNYRHMQSIEAGLVDIKLSTLYSIARALKVSPRDLLKDIH